LPELGSVPILVKLQEIDNLTVCSTVAEKLLSRMEFKDYIKDSLFPFWEYSPIVHSISVAMMLVKASFGVALNNKKKHLS